jgi:hypothetical protein
VYRERDEPPPAAPAMRWPAYVGFGLGGLALIGGVVEHSAALSARDEANQRYPSEPAYDTQVSKFQDARTLAYVGYAASAALVGFGVYWLVLGPGHHHEPAVTLGASPTGAVVWLSGSLP